jgi:hypothetical protein
VSGKLSFCTLGSDELSFRKPPSATPVPALAGLPAVRSAVPFPLCAPARVQARPGGIMAPQLSAAGQPRRRSIMAASAKSPFWCYYWVYSLLERQLV